MGEDCTCDLNRLSQLETGTTSAWLRRELRHRGLPVFYLDGRHANKASSMRRNKTDKNDVRDLPQFVRIGWYRVSDVSAGVLVCPCRTSKSLILLISIQSHLA